MAWLDFGSRNYDPVLGRWFNNDRQAERYHYMSPYTAMGNNPIFYTDPNGEFVWAAVAVGAIIGAVTGAAAYTASAIQQGEFSLGGLFGSIGIGALTGAISGAIAPGAVPAVVTQNQFLAYAGGAALSSFLPSANIPISDNFSLSLSPSIALGNAAGIGANVSANFSSGDFSTSLGFGASYYGKAHGTGHSGFETRTSGGLGYNSGDFSARLYSTHFGSGETKQRVGGLGVGVGDFSFRYENDGTPFQYVGAGDGNDSYRTATVQFGYKNFTAGFNLYTGKRTNFEGDDDKEGDMQIGSFGERYPNEYVNETGTPYRLGAAYIGYRGNRFGINSDRHVRHPVQTHGAHNFAKPQPGFKTYSSIIQPYYQYQSYNPFTLW